MLFVFAAPSGTGKTSIVKEILKDNPEIEFSVSATTRPQRSGEADGKDYFFLSREIFEEKIRNNEFVEYEKIFDDNYYGTLKSFIQERLDKKINLIFDLDVNGALSIKRLFEKFSILIFIKPPDKETIKNRLIKRGTESVEIIEKRLSRFEYEMSKINEFNFIVTNDNLENAILKVQEIITKFKN